jgi:molybdenum cofactor biosynthesis enzyme MoaA
MHNRIRKKINKGIMLAYCDEKGNVYDYPGFEPAFRSGRDFTRVDPAELIELPTGSHLFSLPKRYPIYYNSKEEKFDTLEKSGDGSDIYAVSAFLSSGYLRTYLPAFKRGNDAPALPLWAYCGVVIVDGQFFVPALRIDPDPRSNPEIHQNEEELKSAIGEIKKRFSRNRLIKQLALCSTEYRCLCARNFFLSRHEAPVPTTPSCNALCLGCLSYQENSGFSQSQERLSFKPTPEEIAEIIIYHFERVNEAVASFGQGCEGEPLLRGRDLSRAISLVRKKTDRGTININTNGSLPEMVRLLINSGLDSIRISMNSPTERYYNRYYRPQGYNFKEVLESIEMSIKAGIFVSLNLLFLPGFTDMATEVDDLFRFLKEFPVNMIQTRNMNIDPDYYLDNIGFEGSEPIGIRELLRQINESFPAVKLGYYNPPKERF